MRGTGTKLLKTPVHFVGIFYLVSTMVLATDGVSRCGQWQRTRRFANWLCRPPPAPLSAAAAQAMGSVRAAALDILVNARLHF
jgi:hypothetical protein